MAKAKAVKAVEGMKVFLLTQKNKYAPDAAYEVIAVFATEEGANAEKLELGDSEILVEELQIGA